ncbi:RNase adapter RapZ [Sphingomonas oligophenolica]|uniref:RNase adapter RapZ n=1 Tax=Sphingomonas oligophenolica TaxID=301154 RepID=A0ABU9YCI1_9SPHN
MKHDPKEILLVTGMSGAGKSTVLRTLEDLGWEVVDNLPLLLLDRLLGAPLPEGAERSSQPLALGIGARTRDFDAARILKRIRKLREEHGHDIGILFLDCAGGELERRYSETRRRHPLALDRPASDGIARERELLAPLRDRANRLIDTTNMTGNELAQQIRATFSGERLGEPTLSVTSFGFARGLPRNADLVFDMRFLRNPHWVDELRPGTGLDSAVSAYIAGDPAYDAALGQIESLLLLLLPRYRAEGKSYVTIAFGCTGGRHRSVHVAERVAARLRAEGFSPTVSHRDLAAAPQDSLEGGAGIAQGDGLSVTESAMKESRKESGQ